MIKRIFLSCLLFFFFWGKVQAQFYQGSNLDFGKNRVQFRHFDWSYFKGKYADVYFYQGGEKLALETAKQSDAVCDELTKFFGFEPTERFYILVYLSQSDMRQSNIGTTLDERFQIMGTDQIIQNKLFVFFEGDHEAYARQLKQGLTSISLNQIILGNGWKDAVKAAASSSLPEWFLNGLAHWKSGASHEEIDLFMYNELRRKRHQINFWKNKSASMGGAAFWMFIEDRYGSGVIPSIVQMSKFTRGVDAGFEIVLGKTLDGIVEEFYQYYRLKIQPMIKPEGLPNNQAARKLMGEIDRKAKKRFIYRDFMVNAQGDKWAFITHEWGQYRVWVYDTTSKNLNCILKRQPKQDRPDDLTYPAISWHPSGEMLAIFYEKRGFMRFAQYNAREKSWNEKEVFAVDKIIQPRFSNDGKNIVFIGVLAGRSDVFLMPTIANTPRALTKTDEDDYSPVYLSNKKVIFLSKSTKDGEWRYRLNQVESAQMTPKIETIYETNHPLRFAYDWGKDEMGCVEYIDEQQVFYRVKWDSVIAFVDTTVHYRKEPHLNELTKLSYVSKVEQWLSKEQSWVVRHDFNGFPHLKKLYLNQGEGKPFMNSKETTIHLPADTLRFIPRDIQLGRINIAEYQFYNERKNFILEKQTLVLDEALPSKEKSKDNEWKRSNYDLNFTSDYASTQLDNTFVTNFYQSAASGPSSIFPGMSGLFKVSLSDLMEDYRLSAAVRIAADIRNSDFGIAFENNKEQLDKKTTFQRRSQRWGGVFSAYRQETYFVTQQWKYPLDEFQSFRISGQYRWDRSIDLSVDPQSLANPNVNEHNAGLLLEYVIDNTRSLDMNLMQGTRGKIWYERMQRADDWSVKSDMQVIGGDLRHYVKLHRNIIGALRLAGATSFGTQKIVHYLGGVDNWLFQKVDNSTEVSDTMNYRFASFCGPMRGFYVNARNGNSFMALNAEVRLPLFSYFSKRPISSDFFRYFQVIGFADAGSAWTGKSPYDQKNGFNTVTVVQNPITVAVSSFKEPVIFGYGFGLRSKILGYFLRADWAWGIDDRQVLPRVFYLSLNMDF
jgi:hypothetical protein